MKVIVVFLAQRKNPSLDADVSVLSSTLRNSQYAYDTPVHDDSVVGGRNVLVGMIGRRQVAVRRPSCSVYRLAASALPPRGLTAGSRSPERTSAPGSGRNPPPPPRTGTFLS